MPARILVIDDDDAFAEFIVLLLWRSGYQAFTVSSGSGVMKRVLDAHRDNPIDLMIVDLYMPEPDGFELLRLTRELLGDLPVIGISGIGGALLNIMISLGASCVLAKPIDPETLLGSVESALEAARQPAPGCCTAS